jgi:hypothetical protein
MLMQIIQTVATGSAVLLGITYIIGGLIVNLNLARRGVVEYQILKVKYLVVGLIFLLQSIGVFGFAALPAFALLLLVNSVLGYQVVNVISMLAAIGLLVVWSRYPSNTKSFFVDWKFWFACSAIGAVFPMMVLISQLLVPRLYLPWSIVIAQAVMTGALTFMAQLYHYAAFYYGRLHTNALDPIGVGIPTRVRMACDPEKIQLLKNLGVPVNADNTTSDLYLIDETDKHYIISYQLVAGEKTDETLKIDKDIVKAILYRPEHTRQLDGKPIQPSRNRKKAGK